VSKTRFLIPLGIFVLLVVFLGIGLKRDPREVPSPLINKPAPQFKLPQLADSGKTFAPSDYAGRVWLLNVWASWCAACREEHPLLVNFASQPDAVPLVGLNYKDEVADAQRWLRALGDPYVLSISDRRGNVGIDWGVYGVPETFLIDAKGIVRYKRIGPVTEATLRDEIVPLLQKLRNEPG